MKVLCPKPSVKSETHGNATLSDFFWWWRCVWWGVKNGGKENELRFVISESVKGCGGY